METALQVKEIKFQGATLLATQDRKNNIWVGIKWVCQGIGLSEGQRQRQTTNMQTDFVLKQGVANLQLPTNGGKQDVLCIMIDYLPLWLAKISITPRMQKETPELVEKLINYQLKAKDVLASAFLPRKLQQPQSPAPLLERKITNLQLRQENIIDCLSKQADLLLDLEDEIAELKNSNPKSIAVKSEPIIGLSKKDLIRSIIKPLGQKLHDCSLGYKSTYKKVYLAMNINWKYRITRWNNSHKDNKVKGKFELVAVDDKLLELFQITVQKMLQD